MTLAPSLSDLALARDSVRTKWPWFAVLGGALIALGFVAAFNLFAATVASVLVIGALMLVAGIGQLIHAFQVKGWSSVVFWVLSGIVYALAGLSAFLNPLLASAILTLLLAATLVVAGALRFWVGIRARAHRRAGWIVASGLLTLATGIVIFAGWPVTSLWVLGLMLAIDLTFQGWSLLAFGLALRARAA
ncbi:MAG: HdeD family acid-resistance protein [Alphaproteobacteria bacterium]|nr:HdeD family acid-resistance protein [Alphaproteobacteria bacterium]